MVGINIAQIAEMYIRNYLLTPQTTEAAKRAIIAALGLFLVAAGGALVAGTAPLIALGMGLVAAAGAFGVRTSEGAWDSHRQMNGKVQASDVAEKQ